MLERRSALASAQPFSWAALTLGEVRGFTLTQVAGFGNFEAELGTLPPTNDQAIESDGRTIFRTGPQTYWFVGPEHDDLAATLAGKALVTPLSHGRTRISIDGRAARDVLRKGIPLDLHERVFTPDKFAQTGLHHTPVLLHCVAENRFELYAMRTFAMNVWEWLEDAALEFT